MDAATLNRKLAEALGWKHRSDCVSLLSTDFNGNPFPFSAWVDASGQVQAMKFFPATSTDDLRLYVYPELKRRGLCQDFMDVLFRQKDTPELFDEEDTYGWWLLNASPSVLAAAALKVLGGGE